MRSILEICKLYKLYKGFVLAIIICSLVLNHLTDPSSPCDSTRTFLLVCNVIS